MYVLAVEHKSEDVMDDFKRAMQAASAHGMRFLPIRDDLAAIFCAKCGWPDSHRETVIGEYANEPFGCSRCEGGLDADTKERTQ